MLVILEATWKAPQDDPPASRYNHWMLSGTSDLQLTEHRNPASRNLDCMSTRSIVELMNREDRKVAIAVRTQIPSIVRAVDAIVHAIHSGGRLIYVGAGSSGRQAVLDAAECPPTFGVSKKLVVALIAGGRRAIAGAVEGAEDSTANGARDLQKMRLGRKDIVVGIAASGTTPYVLSALQYARKHGAFIVALTSNPSKPLARVANILITLQVGPEVLTGSTRLKAGTAQKMVLNMLSTTAMVRLGHVYENLMIDVVLTNKKVAARALRLLAETSGRDLSAASHALRQSKHNLRLALVMLRRRCRANDARKILRQAQNNLRRALGE
ncbi:MAG TPA: N-acetylmuramic acid 6-phosphate etherase [Terriglobales bacterium]|nr:N-acetylmuramic acid 6-phosphate etherase [Terriglobales bacterium]